MNSDTHVGKGKNGPLTDTRIRTAKPRAKAYKIPDGKGLFLFVTPSGGKLWRWKYRYNGAEKQMPLGQYPDVSLPAVCRASLSIRSASWIWLLLPSRRSYTG